MGLKKGLKRGSDEWKREQLRRFLQSQQKEELELDEATLNQLNKEIELLQAVKERIDNKGKE